MARVIDLKEFIDDRNPYEVRRLDAESVGEDKLRSLASVMEKLLTMRSQALGEGWSFWPPVSGAKEKPGNITYYQAHGGDDMPGMAAVWRLDGNNEALFVRLYAGTTQEPNKLAAEALLERIEDDARRQGLGVCVSDRRLMGDTFYQDHGYMPRGTWDYKEYDSE